MTRLAETNHVIRAYAGMLSVSARALACYAEHLAERDEDDELDSEDVEIMISSFKHLMSDVATEQDVIIRNLTQLA